MPLDDHRAQVQGEEMTVDLLNTVTHRYGVSLTAACRKWIDFKDKRAAIVVARDGYANWGRASRAAVKTGIFVRSGMPIPDNVLSTIGADKREPAGVWTFNRGSEPARALAMVSELPDMSLTILLLDGSVDLKEIEGEEPWDTYDQFDVGR